jgi:hypothetical protein
MSKAAALVLVLPLALDPLAGARPQGYFPFALDQARETAIGLAGGKAVVGTLCGGADAAMIEGGTAAKPWSVMAEFAGPRVAAIEAIHREEAGAPEACAIAAGRRAAALPGGADVSFAAEWAGLARVARASWTDGRAVYAATARSFPDGPCDTTVRLSRAAPKQSGSRVKPS